MKTEKELPFLEKEVPNEVLWIVIGAMVISFLLGMVAGMYLK